MGQRGWAIAVAFLLFVWSLAGAIAEAEAKKGQLSVELDIPDYIPDAQSLRHPEKFFSGDRIEITGDLSKGKVKEVSLRGLQTGVQNTLNVGLATSSFLRTQIPSDVPSDDYELNVVVGSNLYKTQLKITGVSPEELGAMEMGGGGGDVEEKPLPSAVLYTSRIDCGFCYWESVLAGNPANPQQLVFTNGHSPGWISRDGGKTWTNLIVEDFRGFGDPDVTVTADGRVFISGQVEVPVPPDWSKERYNVVWVGLLMRGNTNENVLSKGFFLTPPLKEGPPFDNSIVDYSKSAFDETSGRLFITSESVFLEDQGFVDKALFISTDGGKSFTVHPIKLKYPYDSPLFSLEVNSKGQLMALAVDRGYDAGVPEEDKVELLRFAQSGNSFEGFRGPQMLLPFQGQAYVSNTSEEIWLVFTGPVMAIDRSQLHPGRIYLAWADPKAFVVEETGRHFGKGKDYDIFLSYSDDDGKTWTMPEKVNDDTTSGDQVFPNLKVDNDGVVHLAFIDKREAPGATQYDIYYAKITDGSVSRNIKVNPSHIPHHPRARREPGDYMDLLVAYPSVVYISYPCPGLRLTNDPQGICFSALDPKRVPMKGEFIRGDSNQDERVDLSDAITILDMLYNKDGSFECADASDLNDDGALDLSDAVYLLRWLFNDGAKPKLPFPSIGQDPTVDSLAC